MNWYKTGGSRKIYDEHFDKWLPRTQRQAKLPWLYKIHMSKTAKGLILDAGCGPGILNKYIENGIFLDFSKVALKKRWVGHGRPRVLASVENMPFRDEVFDSVIASELIEHTDDPNNFVTQVYRILKKGGLFIFSFPWHDLSQTHHFKRITPNMVKNWLNPYFQKYETQELFSKRSSIQGLNRILKRILDSLPAKLKLLHPTRCVVHTCKER